MMTRLLGLAALLVVPRAAQPQRLADRLHIGLAPGARHTAALAPRDTAAPGPERVIASLSATPGDTAAASGARNRRAAHARRGAFFGAALGVGAALVVSNGLQESGSEPVLAERSTREAMGVLGAAGALLGALLGALFP